MDDTKETGSIELPADLIMRIEDRVQQTDFSGVDSYVQYVMEEALWRVESTQTESNASSTEVDESVVEERLESLGYLNE